MYVINWLEWTCKERFANDYIHQNDNCNEKSYHEKKSDHSLTYASNADQIIYTRKNATDLLQPRYTYRPETGMIS